MNGFRLSPQQKHLWLVGAGEAAASAVARFDLALDLAQLKRVLQAIGQRHEILRTGYHFLSETLTPLQVIEDQAEISLSQEDWPALEDLETAAHAWIQTHSRIHPEKGSKPHATVVPLDDVGFLLCLRLPALNTDARSFVLLFEEIAQNYRTALMGQSLPVEDILAKTVHQPTPDDDEGELQYADIGEIFYELLESDASADSLDWWQHRAKSPVTASDRGEPALWRAPLPKGPSAQALFATFAIILQRMGIKDVITLACDGRTFEELEDCQGLFTRFLPLPLSVNADQTFAQWQAATTTAIHETRGYQDMFSWEELRAKSEGEPCFNYGFEYVDARVAADLPLTILALNAPADNHACRLTCLATERGLSATFAYDDTRFDTGMIADIVDRLHMLLQASDDKRAIKHLPLLGGRERKRLLETFNQTQLPQTRPNSAYALLQGQIEATPGALALVDGHQEVTFGELGQKVDSLAACLASRVGPDVPVAFCCERSLDMVIGLLAISRAGGTYVPLDTAYPQQRLDFILRDSGAKLLLTTTPLAQRFSEIDTLLLDQNTWPEATFKQTPTIQASHSAYVIYTSGSTGKPKGVLVTQQGLVNYLCWARDFYFDNLFGDVPLHTPIGFDLTVTGLWLPLISGQPVHIIADGEAVDVIQNLGAHFISDAACSLVKLTPSHLEGLANLIPAERAAGVAGCFVIGGEALRETTLDFWREHAPQTRFINEYGPTEATVGCCVFDAQAPMDAGGDVPIGKPIANTRLYVVDSKGESVIEGQAGQLLIGGDGLARGYLNRPALTAECFIPDYLSERPGERLYVSGDLVSFLPGQNLKYLGRIDDQVKIHGHRIELGEVEACLAQHPLVREAAVIVSQQRMGHAYLVGFIQTQEPEANVEQILSDHLRQQLPTYMVPTSFVALPVFPLTVNGKIDRLALAKLEIKPTTDYTAPSSREERILAETWAELLGIEKVGIHDNFFRLGGDSILAIMSVSKARAKGLSLLPKHVFDHQTIAGLASVLEDQTTISAEQGPVSGVVPLTPIQQWFFELDQPQPHHFNQAFLFTCPPDLNPEILQQTLCFLLNHHDALRLRFRKEEDRWHQWHADPIREAPLTTHRLQEGDAAQIATFIEARAESAQASLHLESGPLFTVDLFQFQDTSRLLFICHHLLIDGVSWRILLEDFNHLYTSLAKGKSPQLPAKTTSYKTWAERLAKRGQTQVTQPQPLQDHAAQTTPLPCDYQVDHLQKANRKISEATVTVALDATSTSRLLGPVHQAFQTQINDLLLAALAEAMQIWTGTPYCLVDLEGHGREPLFEDVDLTRTVGWFTTQYPVALNTGTSPRETLQKTKEALRQITNGGIDYGLLRYARNQANATSAAILFNYLGQVKAEDLGVLLEPATEPSGSVHSPKGLRSHPLEINVVHTQGQLLMHWSYSTQLHHQATIENLANHYLNTLQSLIALCSRDGGFTPSDFPALTCTQASLDALIAGLPVAEPKFQQVEAIYPLSPMQEGMLFHAFFQPESDAYFEQVSATLTGDLKTDALERAWAKVMSRHPVLRTLFIRDLDGRPCQVALKSIALPVFHHDWEKEKGEDRQHHLEAFLAEDRRAGFDMNSAPLMRIHLIRLSARETHFVWSHHHLLLDGWSVAKVMGEVFTYYEWFRSQSNQTLPTSKPFGDFLTWLTKQDRNEAAAYWRRTLAGFHAPNPISRHQRPPQTPQTWVETDRRLDVELGQKLQACAREHLVTINSIFQATWAHLISSYSEVTDVVFGATVSGRPANLEGVADIVGLFINTLPVRARLDPQKPVAELWQQLQDQGAARDRFAYASLVDIQGWSDVPRDLPLFESILIFENYPVEDALDQEGGTLQLSDVFRFEQTNFPLTVVVVPGEQILIRISYDTSLYAPSSVAKILDHFGQLLAQSIAFPRKPLGQLDMLTPGEREKLLYTWNQTQVTISTWRPWFEQFEIMAVNGPRNPALSLGNDCLDYCQLNRRANALAHALMAMSIGSDDIVAICMPRSISTIVAVLAIAKAGAAYIPMDPEMPEQRKAFTLADTSAKLVITDTTTQSCIVDIPCPSLILDSPQTLAVLGQHSHENPGTVVTPEQLAYVIYTSGSTGKPKGVMVPHQGLTNQLLWRTEMWDVGVGDGVLQNIPFSFDPSVWQICWPLITGAELVLPEDGQHRDSVHLAKLMGETGITVTAMVPSFLRVLLDEDAFCQAPLKHISCGGEALPVELQQRFAERTENPTVLNVVYGPTEASIDAASQPACTTGDPRIIHIGKPITNTQLYVVNNQFQPVAQGFAGELLIGGLGLARGYLQRPALTAQKFVPHPFAKQPGARVYRTGDLAAWLTDGRLEFLGRVDHQVKIRGFRIELGEIETALSLCPGVTENAVLALDDPAGHGKRLVAFLKTSADLDLAAIENPLRERLLAHMVPARFVFLAELPLSSNGKVDRRALAAMPLAEEAHGEKILPRTQHEILLANIWSDILNQDEIGIDDNFFALGGHSLNATQVISRIRINMNVDLPIKALFEAPTLRHFSQTLEAQARGIQAPAIPAIPRHTSHLQQGDFLQATLPLSFSQQRMWFLDRMEGPSATYNMPTALRLRGSFDREAMALAIRQLVARHETLRTVFPDVSGKGIAVVMPGDTITADFQDLSSRPRAEAEREARQIIREATGRPFDLATGPLFRIAILKLATDDHLLFLNMHHIIGDGWSIGVLIRDWTELYVAALEQQPHGLPDLAIQYIDFAQWQRQWLKGDVLERLTNYWAQALQNGPSVLELPLDRPRPAVQTFTGSELYFPVDAGLTEKLQRLAQSTGTTLFMVLLSAYYTLLARMTGQHDFMVGTPIANRNRQETEALVGVFINTLVLRGNTSDDPSFHTLLERTRKTALDAYAHQDLPFEKVIDAVAPARSTSVSPLFQTMLVLQNTPELSAINLDGLELEPFALDDASVSKWDLTVEFEPGKQLLGRVEYNTDLFDKNTIQLLAHTFLGLFEAIVSQPDRPISQLNWVSHSERYKMVHEWNQTQACYPSQASLAGLVEEHVRRNPSAPAWESHVGTSTILDYVTMDQRAGQLARQLWELGVQPAQLIGVYAEPGPDILVAFLGILKAGAAYLPLNTDYPVERLDFMVADCACTVLVKDAHLTWPGGSIGKVIDLGEEQGEPLPHGFSRVDGDFPAYIIFTSGSTGKPKGTIAQQRAVTRLARNIDWADIKPRSRIARCSNISFDGSTFELWGALLNGATVVDIPKEIQLLPQRFKEFIEEHRVEIMFITPPVFNNAIRRVPDAFVSVDQMLVGGEAADSHSVAALMNTYPPRRFFNVYGPTENTSFSTMHLLQKAPQGGAPVSIGTPITNSTAYVTDAMGQLVPTGVPGELVVGGEGLAFGYLNRPSLTAEKFIPDAFAENPGRRLYRSGDLVRQRMAGDFMFMGRLDHQVKLRGIRIELGEIEKTLRGHKAVAGAVCLLRGEPTQQLVAYIMSDREPSDLFHSELRDFAGEKLPNFMVPSIFIVLAEFPITVNGKIDRKQLPEPAWATRVHTVDDFPSSPVEETLVNIWSQVMGLEQVGIHDNFFEIGGDSILSIQIVAKAAEAGLQVTPKLLFGHQTVSQLARVVGTVAQVQAEQGLITGTLPLTPIMTRFFEQDHPQASHYNQTLFLSVPQDISILHLSQAIHQIGLHHDALRMRFTPKDQQWLATCLGEEAIPTLEERDFSEEKDPATALTQACTAIQAELHIETGPIARFVFFHLGANQPGRLLLTVHHLVIDGVSWRILLDDLNRCYRDLMAERPPELPAKTTDFCTWSQRLHDYATSQELARELPYWQTMSPPEKDPRREQPFTANQTYSCIARLNQDQTQALLHQVPAAFQTHINDVLLTALARAVASASGEHDLLVDLEGHGREAIFDDVDLTRTVGWFTSLYPVKLSCILEEDPTRDLKRIKEALRAVPQRGFGYGLLRYLHPDRPVTAKAAIAFNYLGQLDAGTSASIFSAAPESSGPLHAASTRMSHPLELNAMVTGNALELHLTAFTGYLDVHAVDQLADSVRRELLHLIKRCCNEGAAGYTPSDFPLAKLDQVTLDRLCGPNKVVEDIYPLTPMQEGMLFHALLEPHADPYVDQFSAIGENLDPTAFKQAWQWTVGRHGSLRTGFFHKYLDTPLQVVLREVTPEWIEADWSDLTERQRQIKLQAFLDEEKRRGLTPDQAPLLRLALFRIGPRTYHFALTLHHLILDGWSMARVIGDVIAAHRALSQGRQPSASPVPKYREYVAWLQDQDAAQAHTFWQASLAHMENATPFFGDRGGNGGMEHHREALLHCSPETTQALNELARQQQLTLNTLTQAAWALTLSHFSGHDTVCFGASVSGRPAALPGVSDMVGLFINSLPVRVKLPPQQALADWLRELQDAQVQRETFSYSRLVDLVELTGLAKGEPLFESIIIFENYPVSEAASGSTEGLRLRNVAFTDRNNLPLSLTVSPGPSLMLRLGYNSTRLDEEHAMRLADHFLFILEAMTQSVDGRLADLPLQTQAETDHVIQELNQTQTPLSDLCFHELFEEQVQAAPLTKAVRFHDAQLDYLELNQRADGVAAELVNLGVGPEDRVAVFMERSVDLLVALLGSLKSGATYVPMDPAFPADRIAYMLEDAKIVAVLTHRETVGLLDAVNAPVLKVDQIPGRETAPSLPAVNPSQLAYMIYTSGSTGKPKAVQLSHANLTNFLASMKAEPGLKRGDTLVAVTTVSFDIAGLELFLPLTVGASLVIADRTTAANGKALAQLLTQSEATVMQATPMTWRMLLAAGWQGPLKVLCGGEAFPPDLARQLLASGNDVWNMYGPTETTIWSACFPVRKPEDAADAQLPIGRPIANTTVYLFDSSLRPVPLGTPGLLAIGGTGVARGYGDRPARTGVSFTPDPYASTPGARLYHTGDLARWIQVGDTYQLEFLGRVDHQIKLRGYRIELGEIEALLAADDDVRVAVVFLTGEGEDRQLIACLETSQEDPAALIKRLRARLKDALPDYMVPVHYLCLEQFPLTPNGKLDRKSLATQLPSAALQRVAATRVEARDMLDFDMLAIWEDVLGVSPIGVTDDFFDLGGHSMTAVRLMSRVSTHFGQDLPLSALFQGASVAALTDHLRREKAPADGPLVSLRQGKGTPLFLVHPAGGNVVCYAHLARKLSGDYPIFAFQSPPLYDATVPATIEACTAIYRRALTDAWPQGPCRIVGWSLGCTHALELSRQLLAHGRDVEPLIMIDGYSPAFMPPLQDQAQLMAFLANRLLAGVGFHIEAADLKGDDLFEALINHIQAERPDILDLVGKDWIQTIWTAGRANIMAALQYTLPPYPGSFTFIEAEDIPEGTPAALSGWEGLAQGGIQRVSTPGAHDFLVYPPHVTALAANIDQILKRANTLDGTKSISSVAKTG